MQRGQFLSAVSGPRLLNSNMHIKADIKNITFNAFDAIMMHPQPTFGIPFLYVHLTN